MANGKIRKGLVGVLDLDEYDYSVDSTSPIRATEGTVLSRIPPRVKIRKDAPLELPHIMVLIDDRAHTVIEPLSDKVNDSDKVYDFTLMKNSGSIKGWQIKGDSEAAEGVLLFSQYPDHRQSHIFHRNHHRQWQSVPQIHQYGRRMCNGNRLPEQ